MSVKSIRLANILFEDEKKYAEKVNEALLVEAIDDVQGYIETLSALKTGLVGHASLKKTIESLHDGLIESSDQKSGRLQRIFSNKQMKFATATEEVKKQLWDLYKKIALSSPIKDSFNAALRGLKNQQLAYKITITGKPAAGPQAESLLRKLIIKELYSLSLKNLFEADKKDLPPPANANANANGETIPEEEPTDRLEIPDLNVQQTTPGAQNSDSDGMPTDSAAAKGQEVDDASPPTAQQAPPAPAPTSGETTTVEKTIVKFDADAFKPLEKEEIGSDLFLLYISTPTDEEAEVDFSSLGIQGVDKINLPKDVTEVYIVGDVGNEIAPLPDRFSSERQTKAPQKKIIQLDSDSGSGFKKNKTTIEGSEKLINKSLKPALGSTNVSLSEDIGGLTILQFASNYSFLSKMMSTAPESSSSVGTAAMAAGAAAVGAAFAGGGGGESSGGGGTPGNAGSSARRGAAPLRTGAHSLKNAIGGLKTKDGNKLEDVIDIVPVKDTINSLLGTEFFKESASYDQDRWELLAGIGRKN